MTEPCSDEPGGENRCADALTQLYGYLDRELTEELRITIRGHLDDCSSCLGAYDFELELRTVIAKRCQDKVPESLRNRIAQELGYAD